jgi:DNA-binding CsgD family transcriptional regulator
VLQITPSERTTLQLLADGEPPRGIAARLGIREAEIDTFLAELFTRIGASDSTEAVARAIRRGLVPCGPVAPPLQAADHSITPADGNSAILPLGASQ